MMSVKDKYVDVRYHMNTGKAKYVVNTGKSTIPRSLGYFANKSYYIFPRTFDVEFKPKYRMGC